MGQQISHIWSRFAASCHVITNIVHHLFQPLDAISAKANTAGTTVSSSLSDTDLNAAANAVSGKDVAIVFITGLPFAVPWSQTLLYASG